MTGLAGTCEFGAGWLKSVVILAKASSIWTIQLTQTTPIWHVYIDPRSGPPRCRSICQSRGVSGKQPSVRANRRARGTDCNGPVRPCSVVSYVPMQSENTWHGYFLIRLSFVQSQDRFYMVLLGMSDSFLSLRDSFI